MGRWKSEPLILAAVFTFAPFWGCGSADDDSVSEQAVSAQKQAKYDQEIAACHLDDGSIERGGHVHACDPGDTKKTTVCHVPPGNPANAHTICIGNPAVKHHLKNHGDYLGPCRIETKCPVPEPTPPPPSGTGGTSGTDGPSGTGGTTGTTGAGGSSGQPETPGLSCPSDMTACGPGGVAQCPVNSDCIGGCCTGRLVL